MFTATGSVSTTGLQQTAACIMAIREINNKTDGIADFLLPNTTLKLAVTFARGSYYLAIQAAQSLAQSVFGQTGIDVAVGGSSITSNKPMVEIFSQFSIVQTGFASDSRFSYAIDQPYHSRVAPADDFQARALADICFSVYGWKKVSIFSSDDYFGATSLTEFRLRADELGMTILSTGVFLSGGVSFDQVFREAQAAFANIFVILAQTYDTAALLEKGYSSGVFHEGTQVLGTSFASVDLVWKVSANLLMTKHPFMVSFVVGDVTRSK